MSDAPPFKRDEFIDKPGIVGARWWHEGLAHADPVGRRAALGALLVGGGLLTVGWLASKSSGCASSANAFKNSLDMQRQYGWNFGARSESVTFDGSINQPFDPALLGALPQSLAPVRAELRPYFIPTLLQSATAAPTATLPDETWAFVPLSTVLRPIFTAQMDAAYRRGKALAALFEGTVKDVAVVVDLPGPESVAFAAGAALTFDPVFAVDNWPHPRGVVPAHLTLAASVYYEPRFAKAASTRQSTAPPMFILDRARLTPYADDGDHFDNRHLARLPSAAKLGELGILRLLYVSPKVADVPELDDLNDDFVYDARMGLRVKIVGADAFGPEQADHATTPSWAAAPSPPPAPDDPDGGSVAWYGWNRSTHVSFWVDYPWLGSAPMAAHPSNVPTAGKDYVPVARVTPFSSGSPTGSATRAMPAGFGTVPVLVAAATGAVLGAIFGRNGSWSRSSGGWGG